MATFARQYPEWVAADQIDVFREDGADSDIYQVTYHCKDYRLASMNVRLRVVTCSDPAEARIHGVLALDDGPGLRSSVPPFRGRFRRSLTFEVTESFPGLYRESLHAALVRLPEVAVMFTSPEQARVALGARYGHIADLITHWDGELFDQEEWH